MENAQKAREFYIKARFYNICALFFAIIGVILCIMIYVNKIEGRLLEALKEPVLVLILIVPFAPAIFLSFLSRRAEKKYVQLNQQKK